MSSQKLAVIAAILSLASGLGVAAAFAHGNPSSPPQNCSEHNGQQGVDEQGTADDIQNAAEEVDLEADSPQADDEAGDQQGQDDQSDEQGEDNECGDDDSGDNGGD